MYSHAEVDVDGKHHVVREGFNPAFFIIPLGWPAGITPTVSAVLVHTLKNPLCMLQHVLGRPQVCIFEQCIFVQIQRVIAGENHINPRTCRIVRINGFAEKVVAYGGFLVVLSITLPYPRRLGNTSTASSLQINFNLPQQKNQTPRRQKWQKSRNEKHCNQIVTNNLHSGTTVACHSAEAVCRVMDKTGDSTA